MESLILIILGVVTVLILFFIISVFKGISPKELEKTLTKNMNAVAKAQNNAIKNNQDILKETANINADINKEAVKTIMYSVKEGLTEDNNIYCKHCGASIDSDSRFCKSCGKEQ